jgi:hypothetical protein
VRGNDLCHQRNCVRTADLNTVVQRCEFARQVDRYRIDLVRGQCQVLDRLAVDHNLYGLAFGRFVVG